MKRFLILFALVLTFCSLTFAQPYPDTLWTRTLGSAGNDDARAIHQTADGGYLILGQMETEDSTVFISKLNRDGNLIWSHHVYVATRCAPVDLQETLDGDFAILSSALCDFYITKTDSAASILWSRRFNHYQDNTTYTCYIPKRLVTKSNGDMVVFGYENASVEFIGSTSCALSILVSDSGDSLGMFSAACGVSQWGPYSYVFDATTREPNILIAAGFFSEWRMVGFQMIQYNYTMVWTSSSGAFSSLFDGTGPSAIRIASGPNNYYILTSGTPLVIALSQGGNQIINDSIGGVATDIAASPDDGFVVAGTTNDSPSDIILRRFDASGVERWSQNFGGSDTDRVVSIEPTLDGGYVLLGTTRSFGADRQDIYVIKTGPDQPLGSDNNPTPLPSTFRVQIHPNPFNPSTAITFSLQHADNVKLNVFDIAGRLVQTLADTRFEVGEHSVMFDGSGLASGIYFARIEAGTLVQAQKMVLLR